MPDPSLIKLRQLTEELNRCETPEQKFEVLARAFEQYSLETAHLEKAHEELMEKFTQLSKEYSETNQILKTKLDELDSVNDYLTNLLFNMAQGLIFIDLKGNITTYNHRAEEILEVPIAKALYNTYWDVFSDEYFGFSMKLALSLKTAPSSTLLTLPRDESGKELAIDTTFVLQPDPPEGAIDLQGLIILIRDLTEMRRLQAIEDRKDRMSELGEMAAKVAHEIRNPLGGIKGFASLLERDLEGQPEQQQMAAYICEGTDNLNNLVTNVLNYSRPVKTQFETVDFVVLCEELLSYVRADVNTPQNIKFNFETTLTSLYIVIDPQLIKAALLNLIFNSIQAMPEGGTLTLKLNSNLGKVNIEVIDTGIGIAPENLKKIFSPLFTTKPQGNGFGLSEVFKVVEAHNGTIDVASTLGAGTTFKIMLPLRTKEDAS